MAPGGCTITGIRGGGEFTVIKLPLILGGDGLTEVNLTYHPGDSTEGGTVQCPRASTSNMPSGGYWSNSYFALHADELSMTSDAGAAPFREPWPSHTSLAIGSSWAARKWPAKSTFGP